MSRPEMMRSDGQMVGQPRVKMPDGRIIQYTSPEHMYQMAPKDALGAYEGASQMRARTAGDDLRALGEHAGRAIASVLGIDYDQMQALQDRGIMLGMVPLAPSGIGQKMVDDGISRLVAPEDVKPRRGMFHSFFNDEGGNLHDLGDLTHDVAIGRAKVPITMTKMTGNHEAVDLPMELEKNKLMRLQVSPGDISLENYHRPTPHQIDSLSQLVEKNPRAKFSYDLTNGESNEFKNGVTGKDLMNKLIEFYYSGKTNNQLLRETIDKNLQKRLEGTTAFGASGEWKP